MFNVKLFNKISKTGVAGLTPDKYVLGEELENYDAVLVRSAKLHETEFPADCKCIARAGAGVNNIPIDRCTKQGIVVFNTPGANANAVKELVVAGLLLASRKISESIAWANTLENNDETEAVIEKGKSNFVGPEVYGKKLGVIGLGAIGVMVANVAHDLGMQVCGYDPYLSVNAAWGLSRKIEKAASNDEIFATCDYITIHVPQNDSTKGMINAESIAKMKDGVRILNFARGGLVNSADMKAALERGKVASYVTDFPAGLIGVKNVVAIPHLGASTPESEENCAVMASAELRDYLEDGNIKNSVNFPTVNVPRSGGTRVCVIHANVPNVISQISSTFAAKGINIEHMSNMSRGDIAYTILDIVSDVDDGVVEAIKAIPQIVRVRVIK